MDELLIAMYKVAVQLVPIMGVAVLVFLVLFLRQCIALVKEMTIATQKAQTTLDSTNKSIDKLQVPLDTAVKISETVDQVQESAVGAVKTVVGFVAGNMDSFKEAYQQRTTQKQPQQTSQTAAESKLEEENTGETKQPVKEGDVS